jgi:hypothetical protein
MVSSYRPKAASIQFKLDTKYKSGAGDGLRTRYLNLGNKVFRDRIQTSCMSSYVCFIRLYSDSLEFVSRWAAVGYGRMGHTGVRTSEWPSPGVSDSKIVKPSFGLSKDLGIPYFPTLCVRTSVAEVNEAVAEGARLGEPDLDPSVLMVGIGAARPMTIGWTCSLYLLISSFTWRLRRGRPHRAPGLGPCALGSGLHFSDGSVKPTMME